MSELKLRVGINPRNSEECIWAVIKDGVAIYSVRSRMAYGAEEWFDKVKRERPWGRA